MSPRDALRRSASLLRLLASLCLAALLPAALLGGCMEGGTSTEAGNPSLMIGFRKGGQEVVFSGTAHVYASDSNPGFHRPAPLDGGKSAGGDGPTISFGDDPTNAFLLGGGRRVHQIPGNLVADAAGFRVSLPVLPSVAGDEQFEPILKEGTRGLDPKRPFNIVFHTEDSLVGYVQGLSVDSSRGWYNDAAGARVGTLWVDLAVEGSFTGVIDTAGLPDPPMAIFAPGAPFAARIHGNRFLLKGIPRALMPIRMVTAGGSIFAFRTPLLDGTKESSQYGTSLGTLVPDRRVDSVILPEPVRVLETPAAQPPGPHTFTDSVTLVLSAQAGADIFYSLDGTTPGIYSQAYTKPITLRASATLKAVAYRKGFNHSAVAAHTYLLVPVAPKADPASLAFRDSIRVALSTAAKGGAIHYTIDGSNPSGNSPIYTDPLMFRATTVLKAVTAVPGLGLSQVAEERYLLIPDTLSQE